MKHFINLCQTISEIPEQQRKVNNRLYHLIISRLVHTSSLHIFLLKTPVYVWKMKVFMHALLKHLAPEV